MYFDQCMEFLARMIEKYGDEIEFPANRKDEEIQSRSDESRAS